MTWWATSAFFSVEQNIGMGSVVVLFSTLPNVNHHALGDLLVVLDVEQRSQTTAAGSHLCLLALTGGEKDPVVWSTPVPPGASERGVRSGAV